MAMTNLNIRIDTDLKENVENILEEMGLNMTTAFNIYARTIARERRIPFEIALDVPNAVTLEALKEVEDMKSGKIPKYQMSVKDFAEQMAKEIESEE